jgi:hypothetical protein
MASFCQGFVIALSGSRLLEDCRFWLFRNNAET